MLFFQFKDKEQQIHKHFQHLRLQIIIAVVLLLSVFVVNFYFSKFYYEWLMQPIVNIFNQMHVVNKVFVVTSLQEGFLSYIKLSFIVSLLLLMPIFMWQIIFYLLPIVPNSFRKELVLLGGIVAPILFFMGVITSYFTILWVVGSFFIKFNLGHHLESLLKISEYYSLTQSIMIWSGLIFEIPIILYIMYRLRLVTSGWLKRSRKFVIVAAFIIAAIITPPDPFSQIIVALVLLLFYELALLFIHLHEKKRNIK